MTQAVIGALRVNLSLDSAQFQSGMKNAQKGLDRFGKRTAAAAAAVTTAATAMAAAFTIAVRRTITAADEAGKAAQKFGVAVDELTRLKHAADLSGVSLETLGKGMQRLSRNMVDAEMGLKSPQRAFDALDISIRNVDGTMKSTSDLMIEVADRFSRMEDGASKTGLAMMLFGRAGAELIPMFNAGADGLKELTDEADRLGIVIDTNTAKAAENFNDNLTRLSRAKDGLITRITANLLPSLELLSEKLVLLTRNEDFLRDATESVKGVMAFFANEIAQAAVISARLNVEIASLAEALSRLNNYDFSGAWDAFMKGQEASASMAEDMKKQVEEIFSGSAISQGGIQRRIDDAFGTAGTQAGEQFVTNFETAATGGGERNPFERLAARMQEAIATMQVDAQAFGMATGEAARFTAAMDLMRAATEAGLPINEALIDEINRIAEAFANATLQMEGARLSMELQNDPISLFQHEIQRLNELLASGAIGWEQWKDAGLRAKAALASNILGLAGQLTGALGQMFGDSKAFAVAEAIINTAQAITATIAQYGATPWGLAAAGVAAAMGAAQIATILRTNKGSKSAPGVSGAAGSTAANNNEPTSQQAVSITLQGDVYSRESVEDLIASINDAQRDGHRLIVRTV